MKRLVVFVAIATLVGSTTEASGQLDRTCKGVRAGGYLATDLHTQKVTCQSARNKLRRWLRRGRLPKNQNGWLCYREEGIRICSYLGGPFIAPNFYFVLTRT